MLLSRHCGEMIAMAGTGHQQRHFGTHKISHEHYYHRYCPRQLVIKHSDFWPRSPKGKPASSITAWLWPLRTGISDETSIICAWSKGLGLLFLAKALFQSKHLSQFHKQLGPKAQASNKNPGPAVCREVAPISIHSRPSARAAAGTHPAP